MVNVALLQCNLLLLRGKSACTRIEIMLQRASLVARLGSAESERGPFIVNQHTTLLFPALLRQQDAIDALIEQMVGRTEFIQASFEQIRLPLIILIRVVLHTFLSRPATDSIIHGIFRCVDGRP